MTVRVKREKESQIEYYGAASGELLGSSAGVRTSVTITPTDDYLIIVPKNGPNKTQVEQGSFPTSYIPTEGSQATRAADICSIDTDQFGYNQDAGTLVVNVNTFDTDYNNWVWMLDGTSDTSLYGHSAANGWRVFGAGGTVSYLGSLPENADATIGYTYSNAGSATVLDGGSVETEAHSQPVAVTTVRLGAASSSSAFLNGHIKSIDYIPRRLTNEQLQELTS